MGDVRVSEARRALRVAGCSLEEVDRLAGAFAAVADGLRSEMVDQIAQVAAVRPGDKLILRVDERTSPETAKQLGERISERFPDVEVLVLLGGVAEMAVCRSEASA